ncbi:hypothetical protein ACT4UL_05770 [Bacillus sp. HC-TM]
MKTAIRHAHVADENSHLQYTPALISLTGAGNFLKGRFTIYKQQEKKVTFRFYVKIS